MEKTAHQFCKQLGHMYRAKGRMTQALETVKFLKENPTRDPAWCLFFRVVAECNRSRAHLSGGSLVMSGSFQELTERVSSDTDSLVVLLEANFCI